jgi:hypothetical protein
MPAAEAVTIPAPAAIPLMKPRLELEILSVVIISPNPFV